METPIYTEANELREALASLDVIGRRITAIDTTGTDPLADKLWLINAHNHLTIGPVGYSHPRWKHYGDKVFERDIPDSAIQTRLLCSSEPFLITLDNGLVLAIGILIGVPTLLTCFPLIPCP